MTGRALFAHTPWGDRPRPTDRPNRASLGGAPRDDGARARADDDRVDDRIDAARSRARRRDARHGGRRRRGMERDEGV